jgi:hypothetical protein
VLILLEIISCRINRSGSFWGSCFGAVWREMEAWGEMRCSQLMFQYSIGLTRLSTNKFVYCIRIREELRLSGARTCDVFARLGSGKKSRQDAGATKKCNRRRACQSLALRGDAKGADFK